MVKARSIDSDDREVERKFHPKNMSVGTPYLTIDPEADPFYLWSLVMLQLQVVVTLAKAMVVLYKNNGGERPPAAPLC